MQLPPETIARAGEGDEAAMRAYDEQRLEDANKHLPASSVPPRARTCSRAGAPRSNSSTAWWCARARSSASPCRANAVLTDIVKRVEKGELKPDPRHITELRLN